MHFIAFTCREWKPNSLGRYGTNSSASKTCFVTAMFAHMFIRLIIQNRFHLLLKNFSIWNSLSDVLSAPLFVATISIHLCCLRRWISSRRSSLQRIFRCHIFPCEDWQFSVLVFTVLFAWEMAWDWPIVNIVLQTTKTQLFLCALVIDGNLKLLSKKNAPWSQLLYDVMADTIGYIQIKMKSATLQLARTHARFTLCTRFARDEIINSLCLALCTSLREEKFTQISIGALIGTRKITYLCCP